MTCIVALKSGNKMFLGSDSAAIKGWSVFLSADPKIVRLSKDLAVAYMGSFRLGQILAHHMQVNEPCGNYDERQYVTAHFIGQLRAACKFSGFTKTEEGQEKLDGGLVLTYKGSIYEVGSDFQATCVSNEFHASGVGAEVALGALAAMRQQKISPTAKIHKALSIAAELNIGVRGPFHVLPV